MYNILSYHLVTFFFSLNCLILHYYQQGFSRVAFSPGEVYEIICACEERLIKKGVRTDPFLVDEIRAGILREYLTEEDYAAPLQVT